MEFEDAIASLGRDIGLDLVAEDGSVGFVATSADGGERIDVSISAMDDGVSAVLCADLGAMPDKGSAQLMLRMLEANHMFDSTGGATLSVEDGRSSLARYVSIIALHRGEGAKIVPTFIETARIWRRLIADGERGDRDAGPRDGLAPWPPAV